jgi:ATP-binding cassette subfamily F protein uup
VLDEPTNDLDIVTLQILEEYLQDFPGCVIVVSHDRYFMDKVVDHLLVFQGEGKIKDFPGNYTQYRQWCGMISKNKDAEKVDNKSGKPEKSTRKETASREDNKPRRLTYKERLEMQQLEKDIAALEEEQKQLEQELCSGQLSVEELTEKSKRFSQLKDELDEKSIKWLELSEIQ